MRIRIRAWMPLAIAATAAAALAGVAIAAPNGNSSSVQGSGFKPVKLPKSTYKAGALIVHTHGDYAHPGSAPEGGFTDRTQLFFDNDGKINTTGIPRCDKTEIQGQLTMKQAMAACGTAKVGTGTAQALAGPNVVNACVLVFNGKPTPQGQPTDLIFTRAQVAVPSSIDCANPAANEQGNTTVLLEGVVKPNPASLGADFKGGKMLDVQNIQAASLLPLTDFKVTTQRGKYISARCGDANKKLNIKAKFTYSDGQSDTVGAATACKVG
jgi:hypothetical protein